jgi:hypothetical protein
MIKIRQLIFLLTVLSTITSCSHLDTSSNKGPNTTSWDFDHNVQFKQTKLDDKHFQLEIIPNNNAKFQQLATFLLRKSYRLCGDYNYTIEMIQGIEGFDDKRAMPNYIFPSLIAKVKC